MQLVQLPVADTFAWSPTGVRATRLLTHNPMNETSPALRHGDLIRTDYGQQMVTHCFSTLLDAGSCEVIDTGFASR